MTRPLVVLLLLSIIAYAATTRLYLKDGTFQLVREYKVVEDRVRYYSTERGDWEEIPLDMIDLKRTAGEAESREAQEKEEATVSAAEDKAERAMREEVARVPVEPGVYLVAGDKLKTIPLADTKIANDKKRNLLKMMSPIPIVAGKGTLEVDGPTSANVVDSPLPEFYIRLTREERFGMVRLNARKGNRVVEELTIVPVTKEIVEKQDEVEVFRHQSAGDLYKIWPKKPLEPGEYAIVEFTPAEDRPMLAIMTWDFSYAVKK